MTTPNLSRGNFPLCCPVLLVICLLLACGRLPAFEATGTVEEFNAANSMLRIQANGRQHSVAIAKDAQIFGTNGQPLADGWLSGELKRGASVTLTVNRGDRGPEVQVLRLGAKSADAAAAPASGGKTSTGMKPLTEMTAQDWYKGEDGGLYGGGNNTPPPGLLGQAGKQTEAIIPLDPDGRPSPDGRIGLVSISMSNATQEFSLFKQLADRDPAKSPHVTIVDCAQGGQAMAEWADPRARAWTEAERRLAPAGITPAQVQVVWIKLANKSPRGELGEHGKKLRDDTLAVLRNAAARFPNLRIAYLGSRIYGGYAGSPLNPEPYAYESAFIVRWLIRDQVPDDGGGNGGTKTPLLLWGPYFWADGTTPRRDDGLVWERKDLGGDGTHPSESGRLKVASMLLKFFREDPLASRWFAGKQPR